MKFDYLFSLRPSTVCNYRCSYCFRHDEIELHDKKNEFDIDSMVWHSGQRPNNLFNFCGYGETMMHPQFSDMIIALTSVTHINWVTNGTMFESRAFERILSEANHKNITDVVVSLHFGQIRDFSEYFSSLRSAMFELRDCGIRTHMTTMLTDDNVDSVLYYRRYFDNLVIRHPFPRYTQNKVTVYHSYSDATMEKLKKANVVPVVEYDIIPAPYNGLKCLNGHRIFEVMHDGSIFDCSLDENRIKIGNINVKVAISALDGNRICKSSCSECDPMLMDGYHLLS